MKERGATLRGATLLVGCWLFIFSSCGCDELVNAIADEWVIYNEAECERNQCCVCCDCVCGTDLFVAIESDDDDVAEIVRDDDATTREIGRDDDVAEIATSSQTTKSAMAIDDENHYEKHVG